MSWLDAPEQDRIVVFYDDGAIIAVGRPTGVVWLWGEYQVILANVKIPVGKHVVMVRFSEFDRMAAARMVFDRDHDDDDVVMAKLEREFTR